ncbi:replicative DNA helicase [Nonomuraea sp. NPDC049400]|uniref:replicative DNA helicase n=1 Tax=Nonomuraea sp. NPDC049400 TaxID=3364352 RepID=UPI00378FAEF3
MTVETFVDGWTPSPAVIAAEQAVVGAAIQNRENVEAAADIVSARDFHSPRHSVVFAAAVDLAEHGKPVDPAAVLNAIAASGDLARIGSNAGPALAALIEHACVGPAVPYHARLVKADANRRAMLEAGQRIQQLASRAGYDDEADPDIARKILEDALSAVTDRPLLTAAELVGPVMDDLADKSAEQTGVKTGYADLDDILPGMRSGQLIVVGARPGIGKTTIGLDIARHVGIRLGEHALFVSLEMSHTEVMHRLIAAESRVDLHRMQTRDLSEDDYVRMAKGVPRIAEGHLSIDDTPAAGLSHIRSRLRGMARTAPARLVVVDYLQLMATGKAENRQQQVADLSRGLKLIAREFEVPVMVLAQLNRGSEHRQDKRPQMSDLRESGAVEQDADVVLLLHREAAANPESKHAGTVEVIVAKQRQGRTGSVTLGWQGHYGRCVNHVQPWTPTAALESR